MIDSHVVGVSKPDAKIFDFGLAAFTEFERSRIAYVGDSVEAFYEAAIAVCDAPDKAAMSDRARQLADRLYSSRAAVQQIVSVLN